MVTKSRKNSAKRKKIKVLNLNKETVKDLSGNEAKRLKGGATGFCLGSGPHINLSTDSAAQSLTASTAQTSAGLGSTISVGRQ